MRKTGPHELLRFGERGCGKRKQYFWMAKAGALSVALALCPVPKVQAASIVARSFLDLSEVKT